MPEQDPIDSLFRDALREAKVPAPNGVLEAVQAKMAVSAAGSTASAGLGAMAKASLWAMTAMALATTVWWISEDTDSQESMTVAHDAAQITPSLPSKEPEMEEGPALEEARPAHSEVEPSTARFDEGFDTVHLFHQQHPVLPALEAVASRNAPSSTVPRVPVVSTPTCKGSAQGRMSDLAGGCIQFESISQTDAQSLWRIDGELKNVNRGSHCPNFGSRDRISMVLIVRHSTGCVDSQLYWIQAPKLELPTYVIPDVITPNGDGLNDQFYVEFERYPQRYELLIFDQLNRLVFRSENPSEYWRAQCYQTPCPAGLYRVVLTTQFEGQTEAKVNRQPLLIKK